MSKHQAAIDHLNRGEWQAAHEIVQNLEDPLAYWLHALVHRLEGDLDNARYWYRRAKRSFDPSVSVADELTLGQVGAILLYDGLLRQHGSVLTQPVLAQPFL